ncbi:hypothetical protein HOLleu_13675 [Holothuria leucospilota]|uniref:Endonuclease/exonuclease/phosphatase domain-containing protein n=1 Tax=Holothuria leucospilota TaxID=206669 RepID=A0A9Q1C7M1_HOLLE|nr:hypothetical protein HOLleu_13675 [Holothuria leucospilota]
MSRGVCILFNPLLDVNIIRWYASLDGRFIVVEVTISGRNFVIVSLYGPNVDDEDFFHKLLLKLNDYPIDSLIIGGDFNFVFNLQLDKQGGLLRTNFNARSKCLELISTFDLIDIWRERNPHKKISVGGQILLRVFAAGLIFFLFHAIWNHRLLIVFFHLAYNRTILL